MPRCEAWTGRNAGSKSRGEGSGWLGIACHREHGVGRVNDGGEALLRIVGNANRELRLPGLVQGLAQLVVQALRLLGTQLDRRDSEPPTAECHHPSARLPEL